MNQFYCFDCGFNLDYIQSKYNQCKGCDCVLCDGCKPIHYTMCGLIIPSKLVN